MYCTTCGNRMLDQDRFCAQCGKPVSATSASYQVPPRPLERDMFQKKIGGVCAGFANYLAMDVTLFRMLFVVATFCTGLPFFFYFFAWLIMPRNDLRGIPVSHQIA